MLAAYPPWLLRAGAALVSILGAAALIPLAPHIVACWLLRGARAHPPLPKPPVATIALWILGALVNISATTTRSLSWFGVFLGVGLALLLHYAGDRLQLRRVQQLEPEAV